MASETMELECPSCKLMLEIDVAFAGGVCRCSSCGTLMTVPRDPKIERAESLRRPDRPGGPEGTAGPGTPVRPDAPIGSQTPAAGNVPPVDEPAVSSPRPSAPTGQPAAAATVDEGVYVTESGKEVRITAQTRIPTAVKHKAIKIGIVGGFVIVMLGMVVIVLVGIAVMLNPGNSKRTDQQVAADVQKARGNYDPAVNPFLLKQHNVLGLNVKSSVVVVLDTSNQSKNWLSMAADAIIAGLARPHDEVDASPVAQVIFANDGGPTLAPETLAKLTEDSRAKIKDALLHVRPMGQATLTPALSMALANKPQQIILITAQDIDQTRLKAITDAIDNTSAQSKDQPKSSVQFDVVYLGQNAGQIEALVTRHQGTLVSLPVLTLQSWYQSWLDQPQPEEPQP